MIQSTKLRDCRITVCGVDFFPLYEEGRPKNLIFQMKSAPNSECLFTYLFWVRVTVLFQTNLYARVHGFGILLAHTHKIFDICLTMHH
jgi:hypothetical protein